MDDDIQLDNAIQGVDNGPPAPIDQVGAPEIPPMPEYENIMAGLFDNDQQLVEDVPPAPVQRTQQVQQQPQPVQQPVIPQQVQQPVRPQEQSQQAPQPSQEDIELDNLLKRTDAFYNNEVIAKEMMRAARLNPDNPDAAALFGQNLLLQAFALKNQRDTKKAMAELTAQVENLRQEALIAPRENNAVQLFQGIAKQHNVPREVQEIIGHAYAAHINEGMDPQKAAALVFKPFIKLTPVRPQPRNDQPDVRKALAARGGNLGHTKTTNRDLLTKLIQFENTGKGF